MSEPGMVGCKIFCSTIMEQLSVQQIKDVGSNPRDANVDENPINDELEWDINDNRWCLPGSHSYPTLPQEASPSLAAPHTSNTDIAASDLHLDNQTNDEQDHFMLDGPATWIGQK